MTASGEIGRVSEEGKRFILALALGPVGDFIAGGRRSRDLWYGSRLLSELTRQAAIALDGTGRATLLIPLKGSLRDYWEKTYRGPVIPNKILALVQAEDGAVVRSYAELARTATLDFLASEVAKLREDATWRESLRLDDAALQAQGEAIRHGDFVEFYAAWAPIGADEKRAVARARDRLLAGRKMARVFPAPTWTKAGRPKCSLDPGRDSAMVEMDQAGEPENPGSQFAIAKTLLSRVARGIRRDERLDAIGLLRRRAAFEGSETSGNGGGLRLPRLPFPPLTRVAAEPWLRGAGTGAAGDLKQVSDILENLGNARRGDDLNPLFLISSPCREPGGDAGERGVFPFDPSVLLENGILTLLREIDHPRLNPGRALDGAYAKMREEAAKALHDLKQPVRRLHARLGYPSPYYAMVEADGDDMGSILGRLTGGHRESAVKALGEFAKDAWKQVDRCHGFAFYIGGDELAAYLPVDDALPLVEKLAELFREKMLKAGICTKADCPTLSAGVVIANQKEDMRAVRGWARDALKAAKEARRRRSSRAGWLCVEERPAGGTARATIDSIKELIGRQRQWRESIASLGEGRDLSLATAHDLLEWAQRFSPQGQRAEDRGSCDATGVALAQASVFQKLLRRDKAPTDWLRNRVLAADSWAEIRQLANEILLADRIADVAAQRGPGRGRVR